MLQFEGLEKSESVPIALSIPAVVLLRLLRHCASALYSAGKIKSCIV